MLVFSYPYIIIYYFFVEIFVAAQPDHDPNTQHCLCGADADLIMLGLATHEPNFTIIREEFKPNKPKTCDICGQEGEFSLFDQITVCFNFALTLHS